MPNDKSRERIAALKKKHRQAVLTEHEEEDDTPKLNWKEQVLKNLTTRIWLELDEEEGPARRFEQMMETQVTRRTVRDIENL